MRLIRKTAYPRRQMHWQIYIAPLMLLAVIALSLQACNSGKVIRESEPAFVIPYEADAVKVANCAVDIFAIIGDKNTHPAITRTKAHVRISAVSVASYPINWESFVWEVLLQDGVAQVRQLPAIVDYGEPIANAIETCNMRLMLSE